ncbi:hypothetical protein PENTCL1PPCAC_9283 [Pristionchus entomophagus]|uniref:Gamma-tubulin complex component n=1 Tax=Pristionchus entomophagus TaxID=358040 RepID=A0AAV5SVF7_9BILA|nr:hypothetical protein PENTCL1PPCAC_9283 [Pristionchus entomophagus]
MLGYAARVEEERLMWQPLVNEERREREEKERAEERKRRKWRAAFPTVSEYTPDEGITVHRDGSRLFNQLLLLRAADQEWCSENRYTLTPSIVVAEILRFIDVSPGSSCSSAATTSAAEEPLYTTLGQELRISKRYQPVRDVKGKKKHGYNIYASGMFYLDTRLQLDNIQLFIDETRRAEATKIHWIPESVKALSSFAQQFLIDHNADLRRLQDQEIANLARLVSRTHTTRGRVDLVYKLVEPFRGETRWNHEKVDKLWAYVFSFTIEPLVIAEYQGPLLRRLQLDLLFVFLLFADNLYSFGQCPRQLNDEFVFYEPLESVLQALQVGGATAAAGSLSTTPTTSATGTTVVAAPVAGKPRTSLSLVSSSMVSASMMRATVKECRVAVRDARCRLWNSNDFLSSMLTGVQTRARLGALDSLDRAFSRAFAASLADAVASEGEGGGGESQGAPLSFVTIRAALLSAACGCTHALTQEFMAAFRVEGRLSNVLSDAKSIFIGSAMCSYAGSLRGGAAVRPAELREAFSRSLVDAKIPIERRKRWGVDTEEKYGRIVARLEWPLPYVLHPPLLSLLGDARHFILNLLRCSEIIMDIQCDVEHPVAEDCRRPFLLLMRNLLQLITLISELFYKQAQVLVDRYFARVDASTTVDEARGHADALHDRLRDLVGSSGIRKMVRELVDMFCKMAEEIHLFLLSGKITSMEVFKWSKVVERERAMLISMGENMTKNVLADLVTMLKVR